MSDIANLYNEVMNQAEAEKTASDMSEGPAFDKTFFEKVANGEEDAVEALNAFIDDARSEGYSDDQIEEAIGESMSDAGIIESEGSDDGQEGESEFELQKAAAYAEGATKAVEDVLETEMAKTAGVTAEDFMEYEVGMAYGQGYAETRRAAEEIVTKIAAAKIPGQKLKMGIGAKLKQYFAGGDAAERAAKRLADSAHGRGTSLSDGTGRIPMQVRKAILGEEKAAVKGIGNRRKAVAGGLALGAAGAGGVAAGMAGRKSRD
jgi:hypothetical protein